MHHKTRINQLTLELWSYFRELIPFQGPVMTPEEELAYADFVKQIISKTIEEYLKMEGKLTDAIK